MRVIAARYLLLGRIIDTCQHPTPERCPALREGGAAHAGAREESVAA